MEEQCDDVRVTWQYIKSETAAGIIHHIAYQKWLNLSIDTKREREREEPSGALRYDGRPVAEVAPAHHLIFPAVEQICMPYHGGSIE